MPQCIHDSKNTATKTETMNKKLYNDVSTSLPHHRQQQHHDDTRQAYIYFEQELSSILMTSSSDHHHASSAIRTMSARDIDACSRILQECPEICKHRLDFGHRRGYGVHNSRKVFPLLQLCYRQAPLELIKMAYHACPEALDTDKNTADGGNFTALHWACCGTYTSVEVVKFLVEHDSSALYHITWGHRTLLHHACEKGLTTESVQYLLEKCPHHVQARDNHQNTPLHLACGRSNASFAVIRLLTELDPTTVSSTSALGLMESHTGILYHACSAYSGMTGYTALHYACGEGAPLDVLRLLVRLYPEALRQPAGATTLPLHLACSKQIPSLDVLAFLVSQYPRALKLSTSDGCSEASGGGGNPLQLAVRSRSSLQVVRFLYEQYPAALDTTSDHNGANLTLLYACSNGASPDVIGYLMEKAHTIQQGATPQSPNCDTLLYMTCSKAVSHSLVPAMLDRFPDDIQVASKTGDLPLHAACKSRAPLGLTRLLVTKYPDAAHTSNKDGNLPLHLLVKRRANVTEKMISINALRVLVDRNSGTFSKRNHQNQSPFDLALEFLFPRSSSSPRESYMSHQSFLEEMNSDIPIEILRILTPRLHDYQNTSGFSSAEGKTQLPLHYLVSRPHDFSENAQVQTMLTHLLQQDPEACRRVNDLGEMALHIASRTKGVSLATVKLVFAQYPDAIQIPSKDGLYPFEIASAKDDNDDVESLGVVYFLVHRSLFAFENLTRWRDNDFLNTRLCDIEIDDKKITGTGSDFERERYRYQQQTLTEILDHREAATTKRLKDLEVKLQELKRLQQQQEQNRLEASCCIIS
ncbi:MAG: hypothetical protein SGILL_001885 [Bacillariaceae sp.]